jgi:hypothetical protein
MTTTNYFNTLIEIAEDCPVDHGKIPPLKGSKKLVADDTVEKKKAMRTKRG